MPVVHVQIPLPEACAEEQLRNSQEGIAGYIFFYLFVVHGKIDPGRQKNQLIGETQPLSFELLCHSQRESAAGGISGAADAADGRIPGTGSVRPAGDPGSCSGRDFRFPGNQPGRIPGAD